MRDAPEKMQFLGAIKKSGKSESVSQKPERKNGEKSSTKSTVTDPNLK